MGLPAKYKWRYGANLLGPAESALAASIKGFRSLILFFSIIKSVTSVCLPRGVGSSISLLLKSIVESLVILDRTEMSLTLFLGIERVQSLFRPAKGLMSLIWLLPR